MTKNLLFSLNTQENKVNIVDPEYIFSDERLDAIPVYNLELLF